MGKMLHRPLIVDGPTLRNIILEFCIVDLQEDKFRKNPSTITWCYNSHKLKKVIFTNCVTIGETLMVEVKLSFVLPFIL